MQCSDAALNESNTAAIIFLEQSSNRSWCNAATIYVEVPMFHLSSMNLEHATLDDEDWFGCEACGQDGSDKSFATATGVIPG